MTRDQFVGWVLIVAAVVVPVVVIGGSVLVARFRKDGVR